tara:strand:+ start:107 stop:670 length:564 start_codon:yes stop_codon:yes gene_type:complete
VGFYEIIFDGHRAKFGSGSFVSMKKLKNSYIVLFISMGLVSCLPEANYPIEPVIKFIAFDISEDNTAVLSIEFTDGDGDLGLNSSDILPPFCSTCDHHFNLMCEYDELRDGEWTHIPLVPAQGQVPFYYRVPRVNPSGSNPALKGVIEIAMNTWSLQSEYDTLRYRITLEDRGLNLSNEDTTIVILK